MPSNVENEAASYREVVQSREDPAVRLFQTREPGDLGEPGTESREEVSGSSEFSSIGNAARNGSDAPNGRSSKAKSSRYHLVEVR